jgi:hypothetical protein
MNARSAGREPTARPNKAQDLSLQGAEQPTEATLAAEPPERNGKKPKPQAET